MVMGVRTPALPGLVAKDSRRGRAIEYGAVSSILLILGEYAEYARGWQLLAHPVPVSCGQVCVLRRMEVEISKIIFERIMENDVQQTTILCNCILYAWLKSGGLPAGSYLRGRTSVGPRI